MIKLSLFALTDDASKRVQRFNLSQDVQDALTDFMLEQEKSFLAYAQDEHDFDGRYKPEKGECLVIRGYDDIDDLHYAIENPLSIPEIAPKTENFENIKALFSGYKNDRGEQIILIQNFNRRKIISPEGLSIFHSSNVYKKVDGVGVTIDYRLSAIMKNSEIRFFSFHNVRQIFDLTQYYIEATNSDIQDFAKIDKLHVDDIDTFIVNADSWVRRKVALIQQSGIFEAMTPATIKAAAEYFHININIKAIDGVEKIILPSKKAELKKVLRFLDEDYYKSILSNKSMMTNSKVAAS
ncbi:Kiwa anti-phage protein KwaB-like domain-containing protein [Methylobacterium sp. SyP6R]|uniref:Kiwa anti-phage protein KwaB-like domain-containing protein n=1 Tax=Methylobacterium sp. SyP6R TaxID=2718876 RepID=UPI001F38156E|nr:Kiwa anti-phage protein KwaB-like domain-containing protein [Methylobacterium sp. SyP6R]MCF4123936.1 DUF4868 domain-containing protein [Methylobacterium sp. SyP6R]